MKRAFSVETMSPEVSDDEDSTRRVAIPFIWESSKMTDIKRVLDADYRQSLVAQSRRQSVQIYNRRRENTDSEGHPELGHLVHVRHGVMRLELIIYLLTCLNSCCFYDSQIVFILSIYFLCYFFIGYNLRCLYVYTCT